MSLGVVMMVSFAAPAASQEATPVAVPSVAPRSETSGASAPAGAIRSSDPASGLAHRAAREGAARTPVPTAQPGGETEMHSPGMVVGGSILTTVGVLSSALGVAGLASGGGGEMAGMGQIFGGAFLGGGVLFLGIGIPLVVSGSEDVPVEGADAAAAPQVRVGAGSLELSMAF